MYYYALHLKSGVYHLQGVNIGINSLSWQKIVIWFQLKARLNHFSKTRSQHFLTISIFVESELELPYLVVLGPKHNFVISWLKSVSLYWLKIRLKGFAKSFSVRAKSFNSFLYWGVWAWIIIFGYLEAKQVLSFCKTCNLPPVSLPIHKQL